MKQKTGSELLSWLESKLTLHNGVDMLYTVDGYEVSLTMHDGATCYAMQWGETLEEALRKLMAQNPEPTLAP